jgi:predicted permease
MSGGRLRRAFRLDSGPQRVERDVDAELEFHLAMRTQKLMATTGLDPNAARALAMQRFGDVSTVRTECLTIDRERERVMKRTIRLDDLRQDAAYAIRSLSQRKGFTAILLLILAFGIGANAAMFTLVDALLLRRLPVPHPEQLVTIGNPTRTGSLSQGTPTLEIASYPGYLDLRDGNRVLSGLYASGRTGRLDMLVSHDSAGGTSTSREPEHPRARFVSGNFYSVLQVPAFIGRTFAADEDRAPGSGPVVVITHGYWQRRFAGDRSVVGRSITINGTPMTIIGVTPPTFKGDIIGQNFEMYIPITMQPVLMPETNWFKDRSTSWLLLMGRLAPGVSIERARNELSALQTRSLLDHANGEELGSAQRQLRSHPPRIESGATGFSYYRQSYRAALLTLSAAVGLILLVVCANVANLMLARASARGREMSVRMAIGAGRWRLMQQLFVESLMLALAGGLLGLFVAWQGSVALLKLASSGPNMIPLNVTPDVRVLAFTMLLSMTTAVLFGLVPALHATRVDLSSALRAQGRGVAGSRGAGRMPLGKLLVVAQVALSMLLLVATGMLVRSMQRLESVDLGIARDQLVIATVDAARAGYKGERLAPLYADLTERLRQLPGVTAVTFSENGIFSGTESGTSVQVEGFTARADADTLVPYDDVGPGYFHAVGGRMLRGRDFEARDNAGAPKVAIINQTMSRFFFGDGDALGRHVRMDSATFEIVGVAADVQGKDVRDTAESRLYLPMSQLPLPAQPGTVKFEIRVSGDPARVVTPVRRALTAANPALAVLSVDPLTSLVSDTMTQDRMVARVVTFFGVLALVLASLGLYGVMAYGTMRRTSEFGLRMALGASSSGVARMVLREAMVLVIAGVIIGVPAALGAGSLIRSQLYGVGVLDVPSLVLAMTVLLVSATLAAYLPAARAARVEPLAALRAE